MKINESITKHLIVTASIGTMIVINLIAGTGCAINADAQNRIKTSSAPAGFSCISIISINQTTKVGLYNKCDNCMIAVFNVNYYNGTHEIRRVKVPAKSEVDMDISNVQIAQPIDEESCH
jgi:hypothetical protein